MSYAENYYKTNGQDGDRPALLMYERFWQRYLGKGPVLEFGCGLGYFARRLARHPEVIGLETNSHALQQLQKESSAMQVVPSTLYLPDHSTGFITALHVFEHIVDDDLAQIGKDLSRRLKPGGRILAVMPDRDDRAHALKGSFLSAFSDPTHINLKGAVEWRRFFEEQWKLDVVTTFADGYYDFLYGLSRLRSALTDAIRAARTLVQFLLARPLLSQGDGEYMVFVLEKRS